jgi:hypothetical protein
MAEDIFYSINGQQLKSSGDPLKDYQAIAKIFPTADLNAVKTKLLAAHPNSVYPAEAFQLPSSKPAEPASPETEEATKRFQSRKEGSSGAGKNIGAFLQSIANTGSFGATPYLSGAVDAVTGDQVPGNTGFLDNLTKNINVEKQVQGMRAKENPISSTIGSILGLLAPGGAGALATKAAKAIKGGSVASKAAALGAKGAIEGVAGQQGINPDSNMAELGTGAATGAVLNNLLGLIGGGVKKGGEFFLDKALGKGSSGLGKTIIEKFGPTASATSLAKKSGAETAKIGESLNQFYEQNADSLVTLPENITFGDIKNRAMDYLMRGHGDIASKLDDIGTAAKNNSNMIAPADAQFLKGILGKEAFQESGLRNTIKAEGVGKEMKALVDQLKGALGEGESSKLQGMWDEFGVQKGIQNRLKPNKFAPGSSPKVGNNLTPIELLASMIEPGAAAGLLGYKALGSIPVASTVGAAGKNLPKISPEIMPFLNLLIESGLGKKPNQRQQ